MKNPNQRAHPKSNPDHHKPKSMPPKQIKTRPNLNNISTFNTDKIQHLHNQQHIHSLQKSKYTQRSQPYANTQVPHKIKLNQAMPPLSNPKTVNPNLPHAITTLHNQTSICFREGTL
jgi:hypothetical protein